VTANMKRLVILMCACPDYFGDIDMA